MLDDYCTCLHREEAPLLLWLKVAALFQHEEGDRRAPSARNTSILNRDNIYTVLSVDIKFMCHNAILWFPRKICTYKTFDHWVLNWQFTAACRMTYNREFYLSTVQNFDPAHIPTATPKWVIISFGYSSTITQVAVTGHGNDRKVHSLYFYNSWAK